MWRSLKHSITNRRTRAIAMVWVLVGFLVLPSIAHAMVLPSQVSSAFSAMTSDVGGWLRDGGAAILEGITWMIFSLAGLLLELVGRFLNFSIEFSIQSTPYESLSQAGGGGQPPGPLYTAWATMRDIANIGFIFAILWIAIATILNFGNYKRLLIGVVVAALLVNFSMFFTKAVIDTSNIFAFHFYEMASEYTNTEDGGTEHDMAKTFTQHLNVATVLKETGGEEPATRGGELSRFQRAQGYFFGALVLFVAVFVFLTAAIMFMIRTVVLMFLIVLAPLAFAAFVLPGLQSQARRWWQSLVNQSFFAPAFLLMIWVATQVMESLVGVMNNTDGVNGPGVDGGIGSALADPKGGAPYIFVYVLVGGLIVAALLLARYLSGETGKLADRGAMRVRSSAQRGARRVGRETGSRAARAVRESDTVKQWAATSRTGAAFERTLDRASKPYEKEVLDKQKKARTAQQKRIQKDKWGNEIRVQSRRPQAGEDISVDRLGRMRGPEVSAGEEYTRQLEESRDMTFDFKRLGHEQAVKDREAAIEIRRKSNRREQLKEHLKEEYGFTEQEEATESAEGTTQQQSGGEQQSSEGQQSSGEQSGGNIVQPSSRPGRGGGANT